MVKWFQGDHSQRLFSSSEPWESLESNIWDWYARDFPPDRPKPQSCRSLKKTHLEWPYAQAWGMVLNTIVWGKGARGYAPRSEMLSKDTVSMIVCTCNLRTPEAEAGGFCVWNKPELQNEDHHIVSLGYRPGVHIVTGADSGSTSLTLLKKKNPVIGGWDQFWDSHTQSFSFPWSSESSCLPCPGGKVRSNVYLVTSKDFRG